VTAAKASRIGCILWRGEPPEVDFYAFWRVQLALHVTAKGIYILGFCTLTYRHIYIFHIIHFHIHTTIHSCTSVITSYHLYTCNRLLLHLIIVYLLLVCVYYLLLYVYICVCFLLYCLVS
jgi:hypothetical protein